MKKRTNSPSVLARLRSMARRVVRRIDAGGNSHGYDTARISAELRTIAERRTAYDR
ncbi:MAG: hypothetical protein ABI658_24330 [Acidimicrobiales bacterium]